MARTLAELPKGARIGGIFIVVVVGFLVSTVCGYMAGLIGASNSPLSGIGILVVATTAPTPACRATRQNLRRCSWTVKSQPFLGVAER